MKVSEVMSRDVQTVQSNATAQQAASFMLSADAGAIPVTDGERLVGMITDRDIAVRGVAEGHGPDTPVRDLMTNDIVAARIDDDLDEVAARMSQAQVRRLPVIDEEDKLCGIVSIADITQKAEDGTAEIALEGVTEPGGEHRQ